MSRAILCQSILIVALAAVAHAQLPATTITYQGELADGGAPADGVFDLRFHLYDASSGGSLLGSVALEDLKVAGGRFTAPLDFGDPYDGRATWLSIEVRTGGSTGAYTTLTPRQPLTAAPAAFHVADASQAGSAGGAATADDADTLVGHDATYYHAWSSRTGVPAGLNDGDDDGLGALSCVADETVKWDGSQWTCAADRSLPYTRTIVIPGTVDAAANGAALMAAVAAVGDPASQAEAWRIRLEPGVFDLGTETVYLGPWTLLEGSGQTSTLITSAYCGTGSASGGVLGMESDSEIRDLTVENTCSSATHRGNAIMLFWGSDRARLTRVTARSTGGADSCVCAGTAGDDNIFDRVTAEGGSCRINTGIYTTGSRTWIVDAVATMTGSEMQRALLVTVAGARVTRGLFSIDDLPGSGSAALEIEADAVITDVTAAGPTAAAVSAFSPMTVSMSRMSIHGKVSTYVSSGQSLSLVIDHSAVDTAFDTVLGDTGAIIGIAATQLAGGPVDANGGIVGCAGVWDETWTFFPNTCP